MVQKIPDSSPRFRAAYSRLSTARRHTSFSSQRLLSNTGHSVSGRVKTRCTQSQSGRRFSCVAVHRSVAFFPQDGQARLPHELVTYLTWGQSGLSQLYSFTPSIRVPQASILVQPQPRYRADRPHPGRTVNTGCEQAFQRSGLKIPPTSGHQPSSPLLFRINQNDGRYGRT